MITPRLTCMVRCYATSADLPAFYGPASASEMAFSPPHGDAPSECDSCGGWLE